MRSCWLQKARSGTPPPLCGHNAMFSKVMFLKKSSLWKHPPFDYFSVKKKHFVLFLFFARRTAAASIAFWLNEMGRTCGRGESVFQWILTFNSRGLHGKELVFCTHCVVGSENTEHQLPHNKQNAKKELFYLWLVLYFAVNFCHSCMYLWHVFRINNRVNFESFNSSWKAQHRNQPDFHFPLPQTSLMQRRIT